MYQIRLIKRGKFSRNFPKIFFVFSLVLAVVLILNFFSPMFSVVSGVLSPFLKAGNFFYEGLGRVPKFFSDKNKIIEENKSLADEIIKNRLDAIDVESIKYENQKLREELKIKLEGNFIAAPITARHPQIPTDSLFLDGGTEEGINSGDLVLAGERIIIGKIAKASKNRSIASLSSFARFVSYGYVARTSEPIEIEGDGGGSIKARVPIDFDITLGDEIMVGGSFNFLAAIVGAIEEDRSSGFKDVLMSLPVDVSKINMVFVYPLISE